MKKTSPISVVDCFVNDPALVCFNRLVEKFSMPLSYHAPSQWGMESLLAEDKRKAIIVLGSASHVHEALPWHNNLARFLITELEMGTPVLGICFGHQLLCHHLGAKVDYHDKKEQPYFKEVRKISFSRDWLDFKKGQELELAFSHSQIVTKLTSDFESLATSNITENEIVIHKSLPFIGIQAHPEASKRFLHKELHLPLDSDTYLNTIRDGETFLASMINSFA